MKTNTTIVALVLTVHACGSLAANAQEDPLSEFLIPPPLIMQRAEEIGLSDDQRTTVQQSVERAHEQGAERTPILKEAVESLRRELEVNEIDEAIARKKLDKLLDAERAMKHIHLQMLVQANNVLTKEQRSALRKLHVARSGKPDHATLERRLKAKLKRVQAGVEAQARAGQPPVEVVELMDTFSPLMQGGKHAEAEEVLDKAIKLLEGEDSETNEEGDPAEASATDVPSPPNGIGSPDELKAKIASMRVADVAWRKIAWKTCLLDGLKASREHNKPVILWVFIDRPVDDKRC